MEPLSAFDATYGYSIEGLKRVSAPPPPADFAPFWEETYRQTLATPLNISRRELKSPFSTIALYEVEYDSFEGFRVGGWLTVPRHGTFSRGIVVGHGYGGRSEAGFDLPGPTAAAIFPCARGFHRSARPNIPGEAFGHVVHGIENRETYVHRGCIADLWSAASVLLELLPEVEGNLHYQGASFGGGMGALMLPWDARFTKAYLDVPSFGNHPLRVQLPCGGSGEAVRLYHQKHPEVLEVLAYFDDATAASFVSAPTFVAAALHDPAVPPPGQFAVYNALRCPKELFVRKTGHPDVPADSQEIYNRLTQWFAS